MSPFRVMFGWSVIPFKMALRTLFCSRLAHLPLFLELVIGIHASLNLKGYTFRHEKTLSLNRSGDPMCRVYFEAMRMRMTSVGLPQVVVS